MKKRILSTFTLVLMLIGMLAALVMPASAVAGMNDVLSFTATASGYTINDTTYCPNFKTYATREKNDIKPEGFDTTLEANTSPFFTDKDCKNPLRTAPVQGQTYYFYIQTKSRMDKNYSTLKKENCKMNMDGITATVLSLKTGIETKPNNPAVYYYVRINCSARIDAQPVKYFTIAGLDAPRIGYPADHSVMLNADQCTATVKWEKRDSNNNWSVKSSTEKVSSTDVLKAFITVTAKSGYYFANNGSDVEIKDYSTGDFGYVGHSKTEIRLMSKEFRMDKLKNINWSFTGTELNSTDSFCYLVGSNLKATFTSGTNYSLDTPKRYLFTDAELKRELKREPKEGVTYYTRISLWSPNNVPTMEGFDIKNATVTIPGFDVTVTDQRYEKNSYSGDKLWLYLSVVKPIPKYTVSFDKNGGSGTMQSVVMEEGRYTLPECTFTAPAGKQFKAWLVSGRERAPGYEFTVRENTAVQAVWEDIPATTYKVTFAAGGGKGSMKTVETSGKYTLPGNGFTAPSGQQFKGWQVDGAEKQPGQQIQVTKDVTVTALWEKVPVTTYTVTFAAGGGKGIMAAESNVSGSYRLPACEFVAPDGQQFKAWQVDGAEKQPGQSVYVDGNKKITALWEVIPETTEPVTEPTEPITEPTTEPIVTDPTEQVQSTEPSAEPQATEPAGEASEKQSEDGGIPVWAIILICLGCGIVGLLVTVIILAKKK